jgi:hypothetical protein
MMTLIMRERLSYIFGASGAGAWRLPRLLGDLPMPAF